MENKNKIVQRLKEKTGLNFSDCMRTLNRCGNNEGVALMILLLHKKSGKPFEECGEALYDCAYNEAMALQKLMEKETSNVESEIEFVLEKAKSSRSKCIVCGEKILKDIKRIGIEKETEINGFMRKYTAWLHFDCRHNCEELSNIDNLDELLSKQESNDRWIVEKAKSSRSKCRNCNQNIEKDEYRIGKPVEFDGHLTYHWYHPTCVDDLINKLSSDDYNIVKDLELPESGSQKTTKTNGNNKVLEVQKTWNNSSDIKFAVLSHLSGMNYKNIKLFENEFFIEDWNFFFETSIEDQWDMLNEGIAENLDESEDPEMDTTYENYYDDWEYTLAGYNLNINDYMGVKSIADIIIKKAIILEENDDIIKIELIMTSEKWLN